MPRRSTSSHRRSLNKNTKLEKEVKQLKKENKKLREEMKAGRLEQNMRIDEIYNVLKKVASKTNVDMSHIDYRLYQIMDHSSDESNE